MGEPNSTWPDPLDGQCQSIMLNTCFALEKFDGQCQSIMLNTCFALEKCPVHSTKLAGTK
jgi:hypothetical protein